MNQLSGLVAPDPHAAADFREIGRLAAADLDCSSNCRGRRQQDPR